MSDQGNLFDAKASEAAKQAGMDLAADNRPEILDLARDLARAFAREHGEVCADDVQALLVEAGREYGELGPAAGALFRGKEWERTGEYRKSVRVPNHSRLLMVWRLRSPPQPITQAARAACNPTRCGRATGEHAGRTE